MTGLTHTNLSVVGERCRSIETVTRTAFVLAVRRGKDVVLNTGRPFERTMPNAYCKNNLHVVPPDDTETNQYATIKKDYGDGKHGGHCQACSSYFVS